MSEIFLIVAFFSFALLICIKTAKQPLIAVTEAGISLQDFAYHILLTSNFWFGDGSNPYALQTQLHALSNELGIKAVAAMPVGVTPIAFLLWLPFAVVSTESMKLAYACWTLLSAAIFSCGVILFTRSFKKDLQRAALLWSIFFLISPVGERALTLGQTSLAACGAFLALPALLEFKTEFKYRAPFYLIILFKPTYILIVLLSLLASRKFKELCLVVPMVLVAAIPVLSRLDSSWFLDYTYTLSSYSNGLYLPEYRESIDFKTVLSLPSALLPFTGSYIFKISTMVMNSFFFAIVVIAKFKKNFFCCCNGKYNWPVPDF